LFGALVQGESMIAISETNGPKRSEGSFQAMQLESSQEGLSCRDARLRKKICIT